MALVFGPSTSVLSPDPAGPPAIIIGTQTIKAISQTQYIIGSQTLTPGGVVTADGTTISLAASGTEVVVGTSTEGLGGYITAGFGGGANGTVGVGFAGVADRRRVSLWVEAVSLVVMLGVVMML